MTIDCNSLAWKCQVPIRLDNYEGCQHLCKYCFVQRSSDLRSVKVLSCQKQLRNFIAGKRTCDTRWCDWNIPLHWGGCSDPFQKLERVKRSSFELLKIFAETGYPVIISTKGTVLADPDYLELLRRCNALVQVSMVSPRYDALEPGAPPFAARLEMLPKLAANCRRLVVRNQPLMPQVAEDALYYLPEYKKAGVHGVIVEGLVSYKKLPGMVPVDSRRYVYPRSVNAQVFLKIREECHRLGLRFNCGDDFLRLLGDDYACCGFEGLPGFRGNKFCLPECLNDTSVRPTEAMLKVGSARCFRDRNSATEKRLRKSSFAKEIIRIMKED